MNGTCRDGAVNYALAGDVIGAVNGSLDSQRLANSHFFDPVSAIVGLNTVNPFRVAGALLAFPALFMGSEISPHTVYTP